jgi:hypothetical protein
MRRFLISCLSLLALATLSGCAETFARINTLQDTKYPVTRQSKIALAAEAAPEADLQRRLAGESLDQQMRALGFNLVPAGEADFIASYTVAVKDESTTVDTAVPTMSNAIALGARHPYETTVYGEQIVPETRTISVTRVELTLEKTDASKLVVWQGDISAETGAVQRLRPEFFRALLEHVGDTFSDRIKLEDEAAKMGQP